MKAMHKSEPAMALGFWARLANAVAAMEMSSIDVLELRIRRLEHQVARLMGGRAADQEHVPHGR